MDSTRCCTEVRFLTTPNRASSNAEYCGTLGVVRRRIAPMRSMTVSVAAVAVVVLMGAGHVQATVNTVNLFSPSNGAVVPFQVYTPPNYASSPGQHFPVVYSLHGIGGTS